MKNLLKEGESRNIDLTTYSSPKSALKLSKKNSTPSQENVNKKSNGEADPAQPFLELKINNKSNLEVSNHSFIPNSQTPEANQN